MNVPVLMHPQFEDRSKVEATARVINDLQGIFRLEPVEAGWLSNGMKTADGERICRELEKEAPRLPAIAVIQNPLKDEMFAYERRESTVITVHDWEAELAPPALSAYLAYMFAKSFINFTLDVPNKALWGWLHGDSRGCVFDFCHEKRDIRLGMLGACFCGECQVKVRQREFSGKALDAIDRVLRYVRSVTLGKPDLPGSKIFIGHGRSDAWRQLEAMLTGMGFEIAEFNREPSAGQPVIQRLSDMLMGSKLAFLVMTAEDMHSDATVHARENVVHEIGLFQGRLGTERAIILKEEGTTAFSNIAGLTYISFAQGGLNHPNVEEEIRKTLIREGLLSAA